LESHNYLVTEWWVRLSAVMGHGIAIPKACTPTLWRRSNVLNPRKYYYCDTDTRYLI